jgi:endoglucanase
MMRTLLLLPLALHALVALSVPGTRFFHRAGGVIMDPDGQPFRIKGVNVSCWLYQENYVLGGAQTAQKTTAARISSVIGAEYYQQHLKTMTDSFLVAADVRLMKRMGINCVRIGFDAVLFNSERTEQWFFNGLDRLMPVFKETGIAVLPVMLVPPKAPDKLWCTGYVKGDTMLWDSPAAQRRTIEIWARIAAHYKDEEMILGYDLLNEPSLPKKRERELLDVYQDITAAIRAVDQHHMLVYEGNNHANDLDVLARYDKLLDANAAYSFHFYTWFGLKMTKHLPRFMKSARQHDRPVFCGEWGINRLSAIAEQADLMNAEADMDGWIVYMWKALRLPTGKEEKNRPPYHGHWFFIPFKDLHMSLLTFDIDPTTRDVIDWMSNVKRARQPDPQELQQALDRVVQVSQLERCSYNEALVRVLGFSVVER